MRANVKPIFIAFFVFVFRIFAIGNTLDSIPKQLHLPNVGFVFNWQTNASAFTNTFMLQAVQGGIDVNSKDNTLKRLGKHNFFVNQIEATAYDVIPLKSNSSSGIIVEFGAASFMDAAYSSSSLELIMNGNAHYKNSKKEIGTLSYRSISYQKLGVGLRKYSKNKSHCFNATIDFISGNQARDLNVNRGSIFTEENGEFVDVDLAFNYKASPEGSKLISPKGFGAALNLNWMTLFNKNKGTLSISISNIGVVNYKYTNSIRLDTSVHFTGFNLGTLNSQSVLHGFNLQDSISKNFHLDSFTSVYNFTLPTLLEFNFERVLNTNDIIQLQGTAYLYNALPMAKFAYLHKIKKQWYFGADTRVGGYGKVDFDILSRYKFKKLFIDATLRSIEGIILPQHSSGLGLLFHVGLFL